MVDVVGQLQRLQELVVRVTAATAVEDVAQVLVEEGSALLEARTGGLWLLAGDHVELADFRSPADATKFARLPLSHDAPLTACVREREAIWIADADEYDRRFPASAARTGVRVGCACLPLIVGDHVLGAAVFAFEEPRPFSEPEKVSLLLLARQSAQTIERLRLIEAERAARLTAEQLARRMTALQAAVARLSGARGSDEVARILIDESFAMLGASAAAVWLRSGPEANVIAQLGASRMSLDATARMSLDDRGALGVAMRTRKSVWLPNRAAAAAAGYPIVDARWDGIEALAFVPLVARDELVGALGISFTERRTFEARDRELVEMFASHAALALEREREDETERLLAEASKAIAGSLDPQTVLERLAELSVAQLADWCAVDVHRDGTLERVAVAHARPELAHLAERVRKYRPSLRHGISQAIATHQPVLHAPFTSETIAERAGNADERELMEELGVRSGVTAPMVIGGRAIGAVTWGSCTRLFDERDVALAVRIAGGAAAALENARLYAAQTATTRRLGNLYELTAALSSARTPLDVCQAAAQHVAEALGAFSTMIWTRSADGRLKLAGAVAPPEWCAQWAVISPDPAMPANRVIATGEPVVVENSEQYQERAAATYELVRTAERVNAFIAVPLTVTGVREGVLCAGFEGDHRFTREERELVEAIARSCEQALERAQLYVNEARARGEAEALGRAKDTFVAMAGHALRNRIAPVVTSLEVMRLTGMREGVIEREIIERQVHDLTSLIDDLLAIARGTAQAKGTLPPRMRASGPAIHGLGPSTRSLRVLVVEDNVDAATVLGNLLRILGHEPLIAHDGPGALACAERDRPHLAFLDLGLPGMDGFELARRLREQPGCTQLPVIALTGYDQASDYDRTREAGFVEHLVKPVDLRQLYEIVGRFS